MTLVGFIVAIVVFAVVAYGAYVIITKFFQPPVQMPLLAIAGLILLVVLLSQFFPEAAGFRVWR